MDEFPLEQIAQLHAVSTDLFIPFVIDQLRRPGGPNEAVLSVDLLSIPGRPDEQRQLRLIWSPASVPTLPLGVPDWTVIEWAALGIASAVVWHFAALRLSAVSLRGDRFDYWVRDRDGTRFGLEVSGTRDEEPGARHREKVSQLRDNPYQAAGFVVVTGFAARRVIFSFHEALGADS